MRGTGTGRQSDLVTDLPPTRTGLLAGVTVLLLMTGLLGAPATAGRGVSAGGADTFSASGPCSLGGTWTLVTRSKRGGILVTVRLRQMRPSRRWVVAGTHNNGSSFTVRKFSGPRGVVRARKRTPNRPGVDLFTVTARQRGSGNVCSGSLSF